METITIELNKLLPNPFKKFINDGKLEEETISKLVEGFKQTTFHENLNGRKNKKGKVELIYGHHRLEAAKRVYGKNHKIKIGVYSTEEFSDENMLLDMIRENMTQRGEDYRDMADCIILTKMWLEGRIVNQVYSSKKTHKDEVSSRDIATFLSNQGKSITHTQTQKYIIIEEKLHPDLKKKVERGTRAGQLEKDKIGFEIASEIAKFDKGEQKMLNKEIEKAEVNKDKARKLLREYGGASKDIKKDVKSGKIKLEDIQIEKFKAKIKEKADEHKKMEEVKPLELKKLIREGENLIGGTNSEINKTCLFFAGLTHTGLIYNLDWNTIYDMLEIAQKGGNQYATIIKKIMNKI